MHTAWVWVVLIIGGLLTVVTYTYAGSTQQYIAQLDDSSARVAGEQFDPTMVSLVIKDDQVLHQEKHRITDSVSLTALTLLQSFAQASNWQLEVQNTQYGALVNAIDGRVNGQGNKYWIYYVNGEMAQVGAGDYIVQPGDRVEFRFEESIF